MNQSCVICGDKLSKVVKRERKLAYAYQGATCDSCYETYKVKTVEEILGR